MTREEHRALRQERINQWQQSGLRLATFARQHELDIKRLTIKRLTYWRTRLKILEPVSTHPTFVPLRIQPVTPPVPPAPTSCLTHTKPRRLAHQLANDLACCLAR